MALGEQIVAVNNPDKLNIQSPSDWVAGWNTLIDAGGLDGADNGGSVIVNPGGITAATHHIMELRLGTYIMLRMRYDNATTALTTQPIVQLFGRYPITGASQASPTWHWARLYSIASSPAHEITMTPDFTNDIDDGIDAYTSVDIKTGTYVIDRAGCHSILAAVKVAATGITGGALDTIALQAAVI